MTAASFKCDDGQNYPTKGFPARTLLHRRKEGVKVIREGAAVAAGFLSNQAGAHLTPLIQSAGLSPHSGSVGSGAGHWLVAYRKAEEQKYRNMHKRIKKTCEDNTGPDAHGNILDGLFLLRLHCVDEPRELCSVDISGQRLNSVKPDDLRVFGNVAYIDASINSLSLGSFSSFVSLRELNLSLNGLCNMTTFHAADFPHLEVLDLSYNRLSADGIVSIGRLARLKVLHLTGNQLRHLPPNLGCSNLDPTQLEAKEEDTQFKALEVLMLDDNKLCSGVFSSLANLKRLKYLNLQGNRISEIPYLQPKASTEEQAEEEALAHTEPNPTTGEHFRRVTQVFDEEEPCRGSSWPLPELWFLNLADNRIAEEEALMAAALFPVLREIDIHSNPLTTQRSGDPPLLAHYLQERLGITIKRKQTREAVKLPLKVSTGPKWKVKEGIPKVSKVPSVMGAPGPAQTQVGKSEATVERTPESLQENTEHFFVTQATDAPEYEFDPDEKDEDDAVPGKLTRYEMLTDARANPDEVEAIGIQTAVRMLEHTLKNLNVYRDSKPKLDSIQTPYRDREKRIKDLPPFKPIKQPTERVHEMIKEIKESTTIREVALSGAINGAGVNKREHKEAQSLLRDIKSKYKMVHKKTMERAASIEGDRNGAEPPPVHRS